MAPPKFIRDVVHDYITIEDDVRKIIDTPSFQRLKRIKQTPAFFVYPCATHTRFEHSLGVMTLGLAVFDNIKDSLPRSIKRNSKTYRNTVKYACLLHDLGHAPLSHVCEEFLDRPSSIRNMKPIFKQYIPERLGAEPSHEVMSCAISLDVYEKVLRRNNVDIELFCKMICGLPPNVREKEEDLFVTLLNSWMDVDKLDYILRDNRMSGATLATIDKNRIVSAYAIDRNKLILGKKALSVVASLINGREALYLWAYTHHKVAFYQSLIQRYVDYLLGKNLLEKEFFSFKAIRENYVDDHDLFYVFKKMKDKDTHTKRFYREIFERSCYYIPLWKTPLEFSICKITDGISRDCIATHIKEKGEIQNKLELDIQQKFDLREGQIFAFNAAYKPFTGFEEQIKTIFLDIGGVTKRYQDIFQSSIYHAAPLLAMTPYVCLDRKINETEKKEILRYLQDYGK